VRDDDLVGIWFGEWSLDGEAGTKVLWKGGGEWGGRGGLCGWVVVRSWIERFCEA